MAVSSCSALSFPSQHPVSLNKPVPIGVSRQEEVGGRADECVSIIRTHFRFCFFVIAVVDVSTYGTWAIVV